MWWTRYSIGYESGSDFEENLKEYEGDESDEENGPDEWLTDKYVTYWIFNYSLISCLGKVGNSISGSKKYLVIIG